MRRDYTSVKIPITKVNPLPQARNGLSPLDGHNTNKWVAQTSRPNTQSKYLFS